MTKIGTDMGFTLFNLKVKGLNTVSKYILSKCKSLKQPIPNPLNIFVYADTETKIKRCQENSTQNVNLSDKELVKGMKEIDKARKNHCFLLGIDNWGAKENYHLCVNTSGFEIKDLVSMITSYTKAYFQVV